MLLAAPRAPAAALPRPRGATREEWLAHGRRLGERVERDRWALGDWACHGEQAYGDLAEAAAKIRIGYGYLGNLKSVARKVEVSRRRETLSLGPPCGHSLASG